MGCKFLQKADSRLLRAASGEVTSGALMTGRSLYAFHMLSGYRLALNTTKAISNKYRKKPRTGKR